MAMVAGLFDSWYDVGRALEALCQAGFRPEHCSVVGRERPDNHGGHGRPGDEDGGDLFGRLSVLLVGLEVVTVPEIGPVLAAGPVSATVAGGLLGALVDLGLPAAEVHDYRSGVDRGAVLLLVNAPAARAEEARVLLLRNGLRALSEHRRLWDDDPGHRYDSALSLESSTVSPPATLSLVP